MASPTITPSLSGLSAKVHLVGHVSTFLTDLFANDKKGNYKSFLTKINEAADDPSGTCEKGRLKYGKHQFLEWKSGTTNRIFGFSFGGMLYVCMAAIDHKKNSYRGMTFDGNEDFDATFEQRQLKPATLSKLFADTYKDLGL